MIRLPQQIQQNELLMELELQSQMMYAESWQGSMRQKDYMRGVLDTLNILKRMRKIQDSSAVVSTSGYINTKEQP